MNTLEQPPAGKTYDLTIQKTGPRVVALGGTATWTIVVANRGPAAAPGVVVADRLPGGFRFVSAARVRRFAAAAAPTCANRNGTLFCRLGTVPRGARATVLVTARAVRGRGTAPSVAALLGRGFETTFRNNVARVAIRIVSCPPGTRIFKGLSPDRRGPGLSAPP